MSILQELNEICDMLGAAVETGVFSGAAPDEYIVLTPLADSFPVFADNMPQVETQEVRISLFSKGNYRMRARQLTSALLSADIMITDRRYIGYDGDAGYFHYVVDCIKEYGMEG